VNLITELQLQYVVKYYEILSENHIKIVFHKTKRTCNNFVV